MGQHRLILTPVKEQLCTFLGNTEQVEVELRQLLKTLREEGPRKSGYAGGNVLNLLCEMSTELRDYDFSNLTMWQADLKGREIHDVNLAYADLKKSAFTQNFGGTHSLTFSPDGNLLAAGSTSPPLIRLWRVSDGQQYLSCLGHTDLVSSVMFSPDGQTLVSGSADHTVRIWNVCDGTCLSTLEGHDDGVWSVAFSPDGQRLASGSADHTVRI